MVERKGKVAKQAKKYVADGYELDQAARRAVEEYHRMTDVPIKSIVRRVLRWFVSQPASVQRVVMGAPEATTEDAYAAALEEIARRVREQAKGVSDDEIRRASRGGLVEVSKGGTTPG